MPYAPKTYDSLREAERTRIRNLLDITATLAHDARERLASKMILPEKRYSSPHSIAAYAAMEECHTMLTYLGEGHTLLDIKAVYKAVATAMAAAAELTVEADNIDAGREATDDAHDATAVRVWNKKDIQAWRAKTADVPTDRIVHHISNRNANR